MSSGWSIFVIVLVVANIAGLMWLLFATAKKRPGDGDGPVDTTGHEWDGLTELNNPLPRWWFHLFIITTVFGVGYLLLYPGMGTYAGLLKWTQAEAYAVERAKVDAAFEASLKPYLKEPVESLAHNGAAMQTAARLFGNNCAACHGTDGRGSKGFPNLADSDWLYGGSPAAIEHSIAEGRRGVMPPMGAALGGEAEAYNVAAYLFDLAGKVENQRMVRRGEAKYMVMCASCHGADASGNQLLGAPNLRDDIWLHGSDLNDVLATINHGRDSQMPAHKSLLSEPEIHLLTAYVYGLSNRQ